MAIYDDEGNYMGEGDEGDFHLSGGDEAASGDFEVGEGFDENLMALAALAGMGGLGGMFGGKDLVSFGEDDDVEPESWVHDEDKPVPEDVPVTPGVRESSGMDFS